MKKLILLLMAVSFMASIGTAQTAGGKKKKTVEERATAQSDSIAAITGCSADQKAKIYTLVLNRDEKIKAIHEANKGVSKDSLKSQVHPIRKQFREDLKTILTPEQFAKLKMEEKEKRGKK
jgi:DNA-binding cell septation regulator SpoVG